MRQRIARHVQGRARGERDGLQSFEDRRPVARFQPREQVVAAPPSGVGTIGAFRVRPDGLNRLLENYQPGDTLSILIARRDHLTRLDVTPGTEPPKAWKLEEDPDATDAQKQERTRWLTGKPSP